MIKEDAKKAYKWIGTGIGLFGIALIVGTVVRGISPTGEPESWIVFALLAGVLSAFALFIASAGVFA